MLSPLSLSAIAASLLALLCIASTQEGSQDDESDEPENPIAHAGELFLSSCVMCHTPPDRRFETDIAWLNQVHDTA